MCVISYCRSQTCLTESVNTSSIISSELNPSSRLTVCVLTGMKVLLPHWGKNTEWSFSKIGNLGKYFDLRDRNYWKTAEKCIRRAWWCEPLTIYRSSDQEREDEVSGTCSMPVGEKCLSDFGGADHLEYLFIDEVVTKGS